ncbi:hypothetical protein C8J56DRAFT_1057968 [Mycena floridula]|nr:hypothetical protein C8J56DRAFT_1057968 [Mycena floridula]
MAARTRSSSKQVVAPISNTDTLSPSGSPLVFPSSPAQATEPDTIESNDQDRDIMANSPNAIRPSTVKRPRGRPPNPVPKTAAKKAEENQKKKAAQVQRKKRKKADSGSETDEPVKKLSKIVLFIPTSVSDADQRLTVPRTISFLDLLDLLHTTIGCDAVQRKPSLQYKLLTSVAKGRTISLQSEDDWEGCLDEIDGVDKKKTVTVQITVPEQYMISLRHNVKGSKKSSVTTKGRAKAMPLLDLDNDDEDDDDGGDVSAFIEREKEKMVELDRKLSQCVSCGPSKFCKIDKAGRHHHLSFLLRKIWSAALAAEKQGVTLDRPPKDDLFGMFFSAKATTEPEIPGPIAAPGMTAPPYMYPPYYPPPHPSMYAGYHTPGSQLSSSSHKRRQPSSSPVREVMASSDPFEQASQYPSIQDFLKDLDLMDTRCRYQRYKAAFEDKDYFHIDKIAQMSAGTLTGPDFEMSAGNADFFLKMLGKKMQKTQEQIQKAKKARLY